MKYLITILVSLLFLSFSGIAQNNEAEIKPDINNPETYISKEQHQRIVSGNTENSKVYPDFKSMEGGQDDIYAGKYDRQPKLTPEEQRRRQRRREVAGEIIYTATQVGFAIICSWWW